MAERLSKGFATPSGAIETHLSLALSRPFLRTLLIGVGMAAIFIAFLSAVQFATPHLAGVDGYYHIRLAAIMRSEGLKPAFPWLPLTILNSCEYYDHHFLFHVGLIPFTLGDLRLGAKWASVLFPAIAFLSIWWLLRRQRVPHSALWALGLLAVSEAFIYRMSLVRAQSLSLAVMVIGLHWMLSKKYTWLVPLGFIYVWLYDAFPMLLVLSAIYSAATLLVESRLELRPVLFSGFGIALGLVVNPYFPADIVFVFRHLLPKATGATVIDVGNEWYPYNTGQLLENSALALVAFFSGVLALGLQSRRMDTRTAASLLVAMLFGLMLFQSRRFVEYFPPFALIFAAFAWSPLLQSESGEDNPPPQVGRIVEDLTARWLDNPAPEYHDLSDQTSLRSAGSPITFWKAPLPAQSGKVPLPEQPGKGTLPVWLLRRLPPGTSWRQVAGSLALLACLIPGIFLTLDAAQASVKTSKPYTLFAGASAWLQANTPPGSRVFQTDWDDFPRLFFYNTHNTYLVGLDPTYLQLYDDELYDLWVDITQGEVARPSEHVFDRFGAHYVVSDLNHKDFLRIAEQDPGLEEVYRDKEAVIFALNK